MGNSLRRLIVLASVVLIVPACTRSTSPDGGGGGTPAGPPPAVNQPPTVRLVTPVAGSIVQNGTAVDLVAGAADPDGAIFQVSFFEGSNLLATLLTEPFQFTWIPVIDGTFSLTAVATDNSGAVVSSDPVSVVVQTAGTNPGPTPPNQPPLVRMTTPLDGQVFIEGTPITLSAEATDPDGPSLRVEYFDGATSIGTATLIPFVVSFTGATVGPHSIRAVATDGLGASTSSVPVSITVTPSSTTTSSRPTGSLNGVFFADSSRGWIVGDQGHIWRSDDGGTTWTPQSSGTDAGLLRVQFVSTSTGWIVGALGKILKTTDGGSTWTELSSGTSEALRGLSFVSASTGWVVGDTSLVLKTTDGGTTWTSQTVGSAGGWGSVSFINASTGWLGGTGSVARTTDGGATWSVQTASLMTGGIERSIGFFDARFVSASRGVMVGATRAGDILRTTSDGGVSWTTRENTVMTNAFSGAAFGDGNHFWAVGTTGKIAASVDAGDTWSAQTSPTFNNLLAVWAVSASRAWAVGESGTVLRTADGGVTWLLLNGGS
jgi:photosystem II stability/assembly factor-like uncharacterized protein